MSLDINSYLGVHAQALMVESRRTELLASNLANADTPNYKARDIDFKQALAAAGSASSSSLALQTTQAGHQSTESSASLANEPGVQYRVPMAPALDGNTVDEQLEQSAFAENSVRYQATLTILNSKLRSLMTAITGS
ncbi:MAG: flagellar basal body rod protein FlgB [Steroidobacteraceae bacterium]